MSFPTIWPGSTPVNTPNSCPMKSLTVDMSKPGMQIQAASCDALGKAGAKKTVTAEQQNSRCANLKVLRDVALYLLGFVATCLFTGLFGAAIYLGVTFLVCVALEEAQRRNNAAALQ